MIEKCFAVLEKHSLLQRQENRAAYSMHKLVHAWGSDRLLQKEKWEDANKFCTGAFQILFEAVLNCVNTPEAKLRLVLHVRENFDAIQKPGRALGIDGFIDDSEYVGGFLSDIGQWQDAAAMQQEVFKKRQRDLGDEHPSTISAMNNLASTLGDQGQLDEAAKMLKEVLEKRRRILGEEHPDTISAMNNLTNTLGDQGQLDEAISLLGIAIQKMKWIHGDEHPHTKVAIGNLSRLTSNRATHKTIVTDNNKKKDKGTTLYTRIKRRFRSIISEELVATLFEKRGSDYYIRSATG
jgi:tetratricopeptide (TPR) repeat protein